MTKGSHALEPRSTPKRGLDPTNPFPSDIATSSHLAYFPVLLTLHAGKHPRVPDEAIYSEAFRFSLAFVRCPASNLSSKRRLLGWLAGLVRFLFHSQLLAVLPPANDPHQCCAPDDELGLQLEMHVQTASDAVHRTYHERLVEWDTLSKYVARLSVESTPATTPMSTPTMTPTTKASASPCSSSE